LGGTSLLAVVTDQRGEVLGVEEERTLVEKGNPEPIIRQVASVVRRVCKKAKLKVADLEAVGIGAAGAVDPKTGIVHLAPNLGWTDVPLGHELEKALKVDVFIDNDVTVAMVGEHEQGAAKRAQSAIAIWVGTGIGGGLVLKGKLHRGGRGCAGEIGHTVMVFDGPLCGCGRRGCVEALASRTAMERDVRAAIEAGQQSVVTEIMEETGKTRMTSSVIEKALAANDAVVVEVLNKAQRILGSLVANLVNTLDPEVVVIGGGLAERLEDRFVGPIRETAYQEFIQKNACEKVRIVASKLGDRAGAVGAAFVAMSRS